MAEPVDPRASHPIPPAQRMAKNVADFPVALLSRGYDVCEWGPRNNGEGPSTQVHIVHHLGGELDGVVIVMAIKSRLECNRLIQILERHRDGVWPT